MTDISVTNMGWHLFDMSKCFDASSVQIDLLNVRRKSRPHQICHASVFRSVLRENYLLFFFRFVNAVVFYMVIFLLIARLSIPIIIWIRSKITIRRWFEYTLPPYMKTREKNHSTESPLCAMMKKNKFVCNIYCEIAKI